MISKVLMVFVGVDTGGTFTDFFVFSNGSFNTFKILSTPSDPSLAVLEGSEKIGKIERIIHGSTVVTNAFLERKGAKVLFITTSGFEDIIFIGRQTREKIYDLFYRRPKHPVEKDMVVGIAERIDARGNILKPITSLEIERAKEAVKSKDPDVIAVGFLFSYLNNTHEKLLKEELSSLGKEIFISSEINPEYREYERFITTVINAYLSRKASEYLEKLDEKFGKKLSIMISCGGVASCKEAKKRPIDMILSGPVGGVLASKKYGEFVGKKMLITFDMGGTSTDVSLIDGEISLTKERVIDGFPIRISAVSVHTVGAGGGSIAYLDKGFALKVGPESAGANPGPICYGKGGKRPTVTDANLILGRIPKETLLAGRYRLHFEKTKKIFEGLSKSWGFSSVYDLSQGIIKVVNSNMERALKVVSMEKGYDPEDFSLVSFGGCGPLHACELAKNIGINEVIVPPYPGVFSAFGMVFADLIKERSRTCLLTKDRLKELKEEISKLKNKILFEFLEDGEKNVFFETFLEARYKGQSHEIRIPFKGDFHLFEEDFKKMHESLYGYSISCEIEIVNVVVRGKVEKEKIELPTIQSFGEPKAKYSFVYIEDQLTKVPVFEKRTLFFGFSKDGPAIFSDPNFTFYLPPGWVAEIDKFGGIICKRR